MTKTEEALDYLEAESGRVGEAYVVLLREKIGHLIKHNDHNYDKAVRFGVALELIANDEMAHEGVEEFNANDDYNRVVTIARDILERLK